MRNGPSIISKVSPMRKNILISFLLSFALVLSSCSVNLNKENDFQTLRYSDFIEAVQNKEISRVLISPDNATAKIIRNDGTKSIVNLAPDKDLLKILTDNNVGIAVQPPRLVKFSHSNSKSSYSDLLEDIESGNIESIFFYPKQRKVDVLYKNGDRSKVFTLYNDKFILNKATKYKVELTIKNNRKDSSSNSIQEFLIILTSSVLIFLTIAFGLFIKIGIPILIVVLLFKILNQLKK